MCPVPKREYSSEACGYPHGPNWRCASMSLFMCRAGSYTIMVVLRTSKTRKQYGVGGGEIMMQLFRNPDFPVEKLASTRLCTIK